MRPQGPILAGQPCRTGLPADVRRSRSAHAGVMVSSLMDTVPIRSSRAPGSTRTAGRWFAVLVVAAALGAADALVNDMADSAGFATTTRSALEIAGVVLNAGWAWAGLAIWAGWIVGRARPAWLHAAIAGVVVLSLATAFYYLVKTGLQGLSPRTRSDSLLAWWSVAVWVGPLLGVVGALTRRRDVVGWFAALVLPAGAALQMVVLPPGHTALVVERGQALVWVAAVVMVMVVTVRLLFVRSRPTRVQHSGRGAVGSPPHIRT